jgi:UDP-N-acetylglucosamine 4,6-dehydratase
MKKKTILITGGTGSLGQKLIKYYLGTSTYSKIICFSRDEFKQQNLKRDINDPNRKIRYFIGDVRDRNRLYRALAGVDVVIHTAALKHVDVAEYNPFEAVETNVNGMQTLIDAAIDRIVKKVLVISSDKACNPINLYGATKLCAEKLCMAANVYSGYKGTKFSVVRFGNFEWSRGSVMEYFNELKERGVDKFPITDFNMTRYWISPANTILFIRKALKLMKGGEIFVPQMVKTNLVDKIKQNFPDAQFDLIGKRPGEKMHEEIMTADEESIAVEKEGIWVIQQ